MEKVREWHPIRAAMCHLFSLSNLKSISVVCEDQTGQDSALENENSICKRDFALKRHFFKSWVFGVRMWTLMDIWSRGGVRNPEKNKDVFFDPP